MEVAGCFFDRCDRWLTNEPRYPRPGHDSRHAELKPAVRKKLAAAATTTTTTTTDTATAAAAADATVDAVAHLDAT